MKEDPNERSIHNLKGVWKHLQHTRADMWRRVYTSKEVEDYPPRRLFLERNCNEIAKCAWTLERLLRETFGVSDSYFQNYRREQYNEDDEIEKSVVDTNGLIRDENARILKEMGRLLHRAECGKYTDVEPGYGRLVRDLRLVRVRFEDLTCLKIMRNKG